MVETVSMSVLSQSKFNFRIIVKTDGAFKEGRNFKLRHSSGQIDAFISNVLEYIRRYLYIVLFNTGFDLLMIIKSNLFCCQ